MKKGMLFFLSFFVFTMTGCGPTNSPETDGILALTANTQNGATVWTGKCAVCHGEKGAGTGSGPTLLSANVKGDSDAKLLNVILKGDGSMPAFSSQLSKQEIADVFGYLRKELQK